MGVMNVFAGIHSSAEEHGNEHNLPGPEVRHVYSFKERAQIIILQNFAIEEFRSSLDSATSTDQFKEVFSHCVLINNESNRAIFSWKAITLKTPPQGSMSDIGIFQQLTDTGPTQPLQMEKCASNLVSAPLVLLLLQPYPLFRGNRARRHAEQEESLASVKDNEVFAVCAVRVEERPRTIRMDRVASVRCGVIGPGSDFTVTASGRANEA